MLTTAGNQVAEIVAGIRALATGSYLRAGDTALWEPPYDEKAADEVADVMDSLIRATAEIAERNSTLTDRAQAFHLLVCNTTHSLHEVSERHGGLVMDTEEITEFVHVNALLAHHLELPAEEITRNADAVEEIFDQ